MREHKLEDRLRQVVACCQGEGLELRRLFIFGDFLWQGYALVA